MSEGQVLGPGEGKAIPLPGARMVFKALSGRASGDYIVGEFTAEGGFAGPRPHVHRKHEELFYVLEGEFDFFLGNRSVRLGPGSFINVPPGVVHDFRNPGMRLPGRAGSLLRRGDGARRCGSTVRSYPAGVATPV
jgi:mannose-6-phosphate isomerase-like protein (cupin superfamily)